MSVSITIVDPDGKELQVVSVKGTLTIEVEEDGPSPEDGLWSPDLFPEMIVKSWFQEDAADGPVASWQSGGVKPVVAFQGGDIALCPTRLPDGGGVLFSKGTKQALTWPVDKDAPYLHRWWLVIARCDMVANPTATNASVLCVNGANAPGASYRQPRVAFKPSLGTFASQLNDGVTKTEEEACLPDFADWNVLVGYRRGFTMQAIVNGVRTPGQTVLGLMPNNVASLSFMGDMNTSMTTDVAIDCVILGQGELTDAQVDKLTGWAMWRIGRQESLPADHPYRDQAPMTDASDEPARYEFDAAAWAAWAAIGNERFVNRGKAAPPIVGYSTVFFDDFLTNTVVDDLSGAPGSNWFAPTHLVGVGVQATAQRVTATPSSYVHDAANHTLALRLLHSNGSWKTGAFSSINNNGQGRSWGKGIFEIRAKLPAIAAPRPGFFPAFWAYGTEHLFWRTRNRLETDFWEYDGLNGAWINISQHVHKPSLSFTSPEVLDSDVSDKIAGYTVGPANGFPALVDIYDGQFHTWYAQIEEDFSYFVIDGLEVARVPTSQELAANKYIMVDLALDAAKGQATPDPLQTYDMVIDYIRVRQK